MFPLISINFNFPGHACRKETPRKKVGHTVAGEFSTLSSKWNLRPFTEACGVCELELEQRYTQMHTYTPKYPCDAALMRPLHERATKWEKIDLRRLENARVIFFLFLIGIEGKKYSEEQAKVTENFFQEEGENYNKYYISFEERNSLICETNEVE